MSTQKAYFAVGGSVDHYNLLPSTAVDQWRSIQKYLSGNWKSGDQSRLASMNGCLDKLSTSLLQVSRVRTFYDRLLHDARANCGRGVEYAALRGETACADFEGLLLQGRSALDRLTWFVASEFGQQCSSFRKLRNVVDRSGRRELGIPLLAILDEASPWTSGLLAKVGPDESLRDFVAHKGATMERVTNCFGMTFVGSDHVLVFDCELGAFPVLRTSVEAVQHLSYLVLNSISACAGNATQPFDSYQSNWKPQATVFSEYVLQEPPSSPLGPHHLTVIRSMHPDGFNIVTRNVRPEIFNLALKLTSDR